MQQLIKALFAFTAILLISISDTHAQGGTLPVILKKSEPITKAIGYEQNEKDGKWYQNNNLIMDMVVNPKDSANIGYTDQNIIWFRSATVIYAGKKYYMFYYHYLSGQYKYPETRVDWQPFGGTKYILVDSTNYFTFKKAVMLKKGVISKVSTTLANVHELEGDYDENKMLVAVAKSIEDKYQLEDYCLFANSQTKDGKDLVSFRMIDFCSKEKYLAKRYFELPLEEFKKVFVE